MPINLDFSNAEGGFESAPVGDHNATIAEIKMSEKPGASGYPYLIFRFEYEEKKYGSAWRNYSFHPKALPYLQQLLTRLGYSQDEVGGEFSLDENELLGRPVVLRLVPSTDPQYPQPNIDDVFDPENVPSGATSAATSGWTS